MRDESEAREEHGSLSPRELHFVTLTEDERLELAEVANAADERIRGYLRGYLTDQVTAGAALIKVQDSLPHGAWMKWVARNLRFSLRSAEYHIAAAKRAGIKSRRHNRKIANSGAMKVRSRGNAGRGPTYGTQRHDPATTNETSDARPRVVRAHDECCDRLDEIQTEANMRRARVQDDRAAQEALEALREELVGFLMDVAGRLDRIEEGRPRRDGRDAA